MTAAAPVLVGGEKLDMPILGPIQSWLRGGAVGVASGSRQYAGCEVCLFPPLSAQDLCKKEQGVPFCHFFSISGSGCVFQLAHLSFLVVGVILVLLKVGETR